MGVRESVVHARNRRRWLGTRHETPNLPNRCRGEIGVPLDLVDVTTGEIRLHCTIAEFEKLAAAEETPFFEG